MKVLGEVINRMQNKLHSARKITHFTFESLMIRSWLIYEGHEYEFVWGRSLAVINMAAFTMDVLTTLYTCQQKTFDYLIVFKQKLKSSETTSYLYM